MTPRVSNVAAIDSLRMPPHSLEAEQSVLGAMLLDNDTIERVASIVTADDFHSDAHRELVQHITALRERGVAVDVTTLHDSLRDAGKAEYIGGMAYLGALIENVPTAKNVEHYACIVREHARRRELVQVADEIIEAAHAPSAIPASVRIAEALGKIEALAAKTDNGSSFPEALDLTALAQHAPEPPRFIVRDWLPAGYATLFAGHGGVGKSALALHLAVCIALGIPFFGIQCERRRVLYLSCEDRESLLHWRLWHICWYLRIDMAQLAGWLDVLDLVGRDSVLWRLDQRTGYTVTTSFASVADQMRRDAVKVLIVDGVSDAFGGNENSRTEVKQFVNALLSLIPLDGALLLLGHVSKPVAANSATTEGYSGSTQWHNAVRARCYLYPESAKDQDGERERTGRLVLELQKSNLGRTDRSITFQWDEQARMFVAISALGSSSVDREHRDDAERVGILRALFGCAAESPAIVVPAATQGRRTAFNVLSIRPEFPDSLRSTGRFWRQIETLRQLHLIDVAEYRRKNRHLAEQYVLTEEGRAQCVQ